jgi:lipoate-protein ligase A
MATDASRNWRLLPDSAADPAAELAAGVALLAELAPTDAPAVRWYQAVRPALVIGSGQKLAEIDLGAIAAAGISVHRRASGGTAVLFAPGLLMQDVAVPTGHPLYTTDVTASYRWLGDVWVATLAELGISAAPVAVAVARADTAALDPLVRRACFGGLSPYEVLAGGRKLVGFAQVRRRQGALIQVGVYTRWPGRELADLLALSAEERTALTERLGRRVVGLEELRAPPPSPAAIQAAFADALRRRHGVHLEPAPWKPAESAAREAARARFAPLALAAPER